MPASKSTKQSLRKTKGVATHKPYRPTLCLSARQKHYPVERATLRLSARTTRTTLKGGGKPTLSKEQVVNLALAALKQIEAYLLSTGISQDKLSEMEQMMLTKLHGILEAEGPQGIKNYLEKSPYKSSFDDLVQALDTHVHDATTSGQANDDDDDNDHNDDDKHKQVKHSPINTTQEEQDNSEEEETDKDTVEHNTQNAKDTLAGGNVFTDKVKAGVDWFLKNKFIRALVDLFFILSILTFYFQK